MSKSQSAGDFGVGSVLRNTSDKLSRRTLHADRKCRSIPTQNFNRIVLTLIDAARHVRQAPKKGAPMSMTISDRRLPRQLSIARDTSS
jgi:hypothetical protein